MNNEILEFIQRRFKKDSDWLNGNCYWFAKILSIRFEHLNGEIFYDPVMGHFVYGVDGVFYDWNGVSSKATFLSLKEIKEKDSLWYERLIRDCVK